jgi:hypothetical protein
MAVNSEPELPSVDPITRALIVDYETAVRFHRLAKLRLARQLDQAGLAIRAVADSSKARADLVDLAEQFDQALVDSGMVHAGLIELSKKTRQSAVDATDALEAGDDLIRSQESNIKEAVKVAGKLADYAQAAPDTDLREILSSTDLLAISSAARSLSLDRIGQLVDALLEASDRQ